MLTPQATLEEFIKRLNLIPRKYRKFNLSSQNAYRQYGINGDFLEELHLLGLQREGKTKNTLYDAYDISNISLHFRLPSLQRMAIRSWSAMLRRSQVEDQISVQISYIVEFLSEQDSNNSTFQILIPNSGLANISGSPGTPLKVIKKKMPSIWPKFTKEIKSILKKATELDFFMLPEKVRWDLDFIENTKMSECGGASKFLLTKAQQKDIKARQRFGLLVAQPYSSGHYWIEFLIEEVWVPADPLLLKLLTLISGLDKDIWKYDRSPGVAFIPLTNILGYFDEYGQPIFECFEKERYIINPIATKSREEVQISLPTQIII